MLPRLRGCPHLGWYHWGWYHAWMVPLGMVPVRGCPHLGWYHWDGTGACAPVLHGAYAHACICKRCASMQAPARWEMSMLVASMPCGICACLHVHYIMHICNVLYVLQAHRCGYPLPLPIPTHSVIVLLLLVSSTTRECMSSCVEAT